MRGWTNLPKNSCRCQQANVSLQSILYTPPWHMLSVLFSYTVHRNWTKPTVCVVVRRPSEVCFTSSIDATEHWAAVHHDRGCRDDHFKCKFTLLETRWQASSKNCISFMIKTTVLKNHEKFGNQNKQDEHWRIILVKCVKRLRLCFSLPFIVHLKPAIELGSFSNIGALCLVKRVVGKEPKVVKYPIRC